MEIALVIGLMIVAVVLITSMVPVLISWTKNRSDRDYRKVAERCAALERETADVLAEIKDWVTTVDGRLTAIEKLLRDVG